MPNITSKELSALEDQLNYEQMLVKKYRTFAGQCSDVALQNKCTQIANKHQEHFNKLMNYLQ
ncbi:MAG: spore coat protein [Hyphomonadaceae bacterium]|nr:spore coat protein [Clostridia bacterium]